MRIEDKPDFKQIRRELLDVTFAPVAACGLNPNDYPAGSLSARLSQPFDARSLLRVIDSYTAGDTGAIVSTQRDDARPLVIMSAQALEELRANLRTNTRKKFADPTEAGRVTQNRGR